MARFRAAPAMSTLPFDQIDNVAGFHFHDDMLGALDVADADSIAVLRTAVGEYRVDEVAGDSTATAAAVAGVANHPGIVRILTGATTAADGDIVALTFGATADPGVDGDIVVDENGVYAATILRIADVDAQKVEFGLYGQAIAAVNSSVADFVGFVWDPEDAANVGDELFLVQVNGGGTNTEAATSLVPYVEGDWVLLEVAADDTSATFRITTEDNSQTITLDGSDGVVMPTVALTPGWVCEAVGANEEVLDIDAFHLRYLRRGESFKTDGYLGA